MSNSHWRKSAAEAIQKADKMVPEGAPFTQRMAIIDEAYPFGPRQYHPYKIWLSERRKYSALHDGSPPPLLTHLSPLERAKAAYEMAEAERGKVKV